MKAKWIDISDDLGCINGKVYDVLSIEPSKDGEKWYRVVDETGEDYLYPANSFEVVELSDVPIYQPGENKN